MFAYLSILAFIFGSAIGSFLNVVIFRLKSGKSIAFGRSECSSCEKKLSAKDMIPIVSFLMLRGRCGYCGKKLSYQYVLVEIVTALLFLAVFLFLGGESFAQTFDVSELLSLLMYAAFASLFVVIFVYDLKHYEILNKVVLFGCGLWVVSLFILPVSIESAVIGAFSYGFFMLLLFVLSSGKWIGGGDVKLAFLIGAIVGFPGVLATFFITYIGGALVALVLIGVSKKKFGDKIPFGTFMTVGAVLSFFIADAMIKWYVQFL